MGESRNMDSSYRIKEINSAREKINAKPYLQGDAKIKEAIKYGICTNLVLNDPEYEITLSELKEAERERIRKEREAKKAKHEQVDNIEEDLANLKSEMSEIKSLLKELVNGN